MKIPIKKYEMDKSLSWEERYRQLEAHHEEETTWMITEIKRLDPQEGEPAAMDDAEVVSLIKAYSKEFEGKLWWEPECHDTTVTGLVDSTSALQHAAWLCIEVLKYAETDPKRLHRCLGFLQGILWYVGLYSIEQIARHNHES